MFLVGIVKCTERTYSLYGASMDGFRNSILTEPDPGPNYAKLMEEYDSMLKAHLKAEISIDRNQPMLEAADHEEPHKNIGKAEAITSAYLYYKTFRCLFVDLILSFSERTVSQKFFMKRTADEAFRVIETELNFVYDQLYTKAVVIHTRTGYVLRSICSASILATFLIFFFKNKSGFNRIDVGTTYALLVGAMCLDGAALIMLVFSDTTVVFLKESTLRRWPGRIVAELKGRRWSGKMTQLNLISYCLGEPPKSRFPFLRHLSCLLKLAEKLCFKEMLDELIFTSRVPVSNHLKMFTFDRLREKAKDAVDLKKIKELCECRGAEALKVYGCLDENKNCEEVEFDESLLLWHIATDLCFNSDDGTNSSDDEKDQNTPKSLSKKLSEYMMYFLVMQPAMMSTMAGIGLIRYRDTCAEVKRFFKMSDLKPTKKQACRMLMEVNTSVRPTQVKGDRSKSVLFDACILAKELKKMEEVRMWEVILEAWEQLLSYAASHCRGNAHARQLSKGGELITLVWLLMAHLGLGEQYRIQAGHATAKLVVEK